MNLFNRLSINKQFILLTAVIVISAGITGNVYFYSINRLVKLHNLTETFNSYEKSVFEIKKSYSEFITSPHSSEFYETGEDNFSSKVINNYENSCKIHNEILNSIDNDNFELSGYIAESRNLLDKFEKNFRNVVMNLAKTGNEKAGLTADLTFSGNRTEAKIKQFGSAGEINQISSLRKLESDFLELHKINLADEFLISAKNLAENYKFISDSTQNVSENKLQIADALSEYINNFEILANLYKETGLGTKSGLEGKIQKIFEESEFNSNAISKILFDNIRQKYKTYTALLLIFGFFIFGFTGLLLYLYSMTVSRKIRILKKMSFEMSNGSLAEMKGIDSYDEFGEISDNIKNHLKSLSQKNEFILKTANLTFDEKPHILGDSDEIGYSLSKMQISLIEKDKNEKINNEEKAVQDRHVAGLANFGGILRRNTDKPELLAYELVSNLVKFLNAEICGIYLMSSENELIPLAAYAYNERKIFEKTISPGEGLVGTSAAEKTTFYFENLPDDYIQIISGFGTTKPKVLLIVPLVLTDEIFGVIEIASLSEFKKSDIFFVETLGADIASTLSFMKVKKLSSENLKNLAAELLKSSFRKTN